MDKSKTHFLHHWIFSVISLSAFNAWVHGLNKIQLYRIKVIYLKKMSDEIYQQCLSMAMPWELKAILQDFKEGKAW